MFGRLARDGAIMGTGDPVSYQYFVETTLYLLGAKKLNDLRGKKSKKKIILLLQMVILL